MYSVCNVCSVLCVCVCVCVCVVCVCVCVRVCVYCVVCVLTSSSGASLSDSRLLNNILVISINVFSAKQWSNSKKKDNHKKTDS